MEITYSFDPAGVDWQLVSTTLQRVGMASHPAAVHQRAFAASHTTVFAWHHDRLIGFGRAISDGEYQAAVYDVAVAPDYQGQGIGTAIMAAIRTRLAHCTLILYAAPGKEGFYRSLGFRRMKTGMALFTNPAAMTEKGFTE